MSRSRQHNRRILFQGAPAVKIVKHDLNVEAEVTPLVVIQEGKDVFGDNELRWGMIFHCVPRSILFEEAADKKWEGEDLAKGLEPFEIDCTFSAWSNPVRWWRALQLLEAMPVLNYHNTHLELYIATGRLDADDTFARKRIEELLSTFAEGYSYEEIMARPVPTEIIQLTIQLFDEGLNMHRMQHDLTDEIEAGTIRWSQELKRIEVMHPDSRRAMLAALAEITRRYRDHLFSYAAFRECSYSDDRRERGFLMLGIESGIYDAVERGIEQRYGMDITAMISIIREEVTLDNIRETLDKKRPRNHKGSKPYVRPAIEERFSQVVTWMFEHFTQAGPLPSKDELNQLLHRLYESWNSLPIVEPLVS